jgi:hypothetical protein
MQIEVPVRYLAGGIKPDGKVESTITCRDLITLEIPEVGSDDAPIAISWNDSRPGGLCRPSEWGPAHGPEHVRLFNEAYWRPVRMYEVTLAKPKFQVKDLLAHENYAKELDDYVRSPDVSILNVQDMYQLLKEGSFKNLLPNMDKLNHRNTLTAQEYFGRVRFSLRNQEVKPVFEAAKNLLVVDGQIYMKCAEPFLGIVPINIFSEYRDDVDYAYNANGAQVSTSAVRVFTDLKQVQMPKFSQLMPIQRYKEAMQIAGRDNAKLIEERGMLYDNNSARLPSFHDAYLTHPDVVRLSAIRLSINQFLTLFEQATNNPFSDPTALSHYCNIKKALSHLPDEKAYELLEAAGSEWLSEVPIIEMYRDKRPVMVSTLQEGHFFYLQNAVDLASQRPMNMSHVSDSQQRRSFSR